MFLLFGTTHCQAQKRVSEPAESVQNTARKVKAPLFDIKGIKGEKISLKDFQGKVVFLDFWATWCPPCVMSSPEVERLGKDYDGKIEVVSISMDDDPRPVLMFVEQNDIKSHVALGSNSNIGYQYGISSLPTYFIVDQEGNVVASWQGYHPAMPKLWRQIIDNLLGPK